LRAGIRHAQAQHDTSVWRVLPDLLQLSGVVVGDKRFVSVQGKQRFLGLGRVGVDNLVPDEILLRLGRELFDVLIDHHKFRHRGDVETCARLVERADDGRFGVGLYSEVALHFGQMLAELRVVFPDDVVVNDHERSAMFFREGLKLLLGHKQIRVGLGALARRHKVILPSSPSAGFALARGGTCAV
jgi:hypothetical protein